MMKQKIKSVIKVRKTKRRINDKKYKKIIF